MMSGLLLPGDAGTGDVRSGKTFSGGAGVGVTGTWSPLIGGWVIQSQDATARKNLAAAYDSSANLTYAIDGYTTASISTVTAFSFSSGAWTTEASDTTARDTLAGAYDSSANLTYAIDGRRCSGYLENRVQYRDNTIRYSHTAIRNRGSEGRCQGVVRADS